MLTRSTLRSLFAFPPEPKPSRITLFKHLETSSNTLFSTHEHFDGYRNVLGPHQKDKVLRAAVSQNFEGISEFSQDFYKCLSVASIKQQLTRGFIFEALEREDCGFSEFDRTLIKYSCEISNLYDVFYHKWHTDVAGNEAVNNKLKSQMDNNQLNKDFYNHYTVIVLTESEELSHVAYAAYFKEEIPPIVEKMKQLVNALEQVKEKTKEQARYIDYFNQYIVALSETDISKLEDHWRELDMIWCDIHYYIQIVHDIEYGYGDFLRTKIIPDFSMRFVDEEYSKENQTIRQDVQGVLTKYFEARDSDLSRAGLFAFKNSMCSINYIPFSCGCSLHFRFSGQSIPNRTEVKDKKGCKIYFDPISTGARIEQTKKLVEKVYHDAEQLSSFMGPINTIVLHVAAHELTHSMMNLDAVKDCISVATRTLLEEGRAELGALLCMKLLFDEKKITLETLQQTFASFALQDLRRFAMYDSSALRPYTISATHTYALYEKLGYVTLDGDKLRMDHSKAIEVLTKLSQLFAKLLQAEDDRDGETLENMLKEMQHECKTVKFLVEKLFKKD